MFVEVDVDKLFDEFVKFEIDVLFDRFVDVVVEILVDDGEMLVNMLNEVDIDELDDKFNEL